MSTTKLLNYTFPFLCLKKRWLPFFCYFCPSPMVKGLCKGLIGTMREQTYTVQGKMVLLKHGSIMFQFLVEDFSVGIRTYYIWKLNIRISMTKRTTHFHSGVRFPHSVFIFCDFMNYTLFIKHHFSTSKLSNSPPPSVRRSLIGCKPVLSWCGLIFCYYILC